MSDKTISHYRILEKLGSGGMGEVYLAEDTRLNRKVALKLISEGLATSDDTRRRFIQEAQAASALNHPHILTIYDIGSEEGRDFIAMEFVEGETLHGRILAGEAFSASHTAKIGTQLASALARAHEAGIIHRDLKPANIMLRPDGYTKILDFGLAKLIEPPAAAAAEAETIAAEMTRPGALMGTPQYMSPEQARGKTVDHRSDIFSLGCVLYEMVTGRKPFQADSAVDTLHAIIHDAPRPMTGLSHDVPIELQRIIDKCMAKDPGDRYQHTDEIELDLRQFHQSFEASRTSVSGSYASVSSGPFARNEQAGGRGRRLAWVLGVYLVAGAGVILLTRWLSDHLVLSPHLDDLVIVALLALLPAVFLFGMGRGGPAVGGWNKALRIGFPVNLLAAAALLVLIFGGKELGAVTKAVTVRNELGQEIQRVIPKAELRKRLAVMFFENDTGDSAQDWLQYGLSLMVVYDLSQDLFLHLNSGFDLASEMKAAGFPSGTGLPLTLKRKIADDEHLDYFASGSIAVTGEAYTIETTLHQTKTGKLIATRSVTGEDLFALAVEIALQIKRDLDIPERHIEETKDLPASEILTESIDAFRLFIAGLEALRVEDDWPLAIERIEQAVDEDPTFALAMLTLQDVYTLANQGDKRGPVLERLMQHLYKLPERDQFRTKASYYGQKEEPEKTLAVVKMWAELYPEDANAHATLALIHWTRDEIDESIASYRRILELDPQHGDVYLRVGELCAQKGDFEEARAAYQAYAERFPDNREGFSALAELHENMGDYESARSSHERALLVDPAHLPTKISLATISRKIGQFDEALAQYGDALREAASAEDSTEVFGAMAALYTARGQIRASIAYEDSAMEQTKSYWPPLMVLSARLEYVHRYAQAQDEEKAFEALEEMSSSLSPPLNKFVAFGYIATYLELEDAEKAEELLGEAEETVQAFQMELLRFQMFHYAGRIDEINGRYSEAIENYEKELQLRPTQIHTNRLIGRCYRKLGRYEDAKASLDEVLDVLPFDAQTHYEMALVYSDMGRREKGWEHLRTALRVWEDADRTYKPAIRARATLKEWESTS